MNLNLITKNQLNTINDINKYLNKSKDIKCLSFELINLIAKIIFNSIFFDSKFNLVGTQLGVNNILHTSQYFS